MALPLFWWAWEESGMREWDWPTFWRAFFEGYGRAHIVGMAALIVGWWIAKDASAATAFTVTGTYIFWSVGSAFYAYSSGTEAVGRWLASKA
jgi:hypothetical protein